VDHHAGRLIDDGEVLVFVEDVEGNVSGNCVEGRGLRGAFYLDGFPAMELLFGLGGVAVDPDLAGFDKELDAGAAYVGESLGEVLVEAEIGGCWIGGEGANAIFAVIFEFDDRDWGREGLFDASGGDVFGTDGAAALAFGKHILRRHG
jgi:hypothetical protein